MTIERTLKSNCSPHCRGVEFTYTPCGYSVTECPVCFDDLGERIALFSDCRHVLCPDCIQSLMNDPDKEISRICCPSCRTLSSQILYLPEMAISVADRKRLSTEHRMCFRDDPHVKSLLEKIDANWLDFVISVTASTCQKDVPFLHSKHAENIGAQIVHKTSRYVVYEADGYAKVIFFGYFSRAYVQIAISTKKMVVPHDRDYADDAVRWLNQEALMGSVRGAFRSLLNQQHEKFFILRAFDQAYCAVFIRITDPNVHMLWSQEALHSDQLGSLLPHNLKVKAVNADVVEWRRRLEFPKVDWRSYD